MMSHHNKFIILKEAAILRNKNQHHKSFYCKKIFFKIIKAATKI